MINLDGTKALLPPQAEDDLRQWLNDRRDHPTSVSLELELPVHPKPFF